MVAFMLDVGVMVGQRGGSRVQVPYSCRGRTVVLVWPWGTVDRQSRPSSFNTADDPGSFRGVRHLCVGQELYLVFLEIVWRAVNFHVLDVQSSTSLCY